MKKIPVVKPTLVLSCVFSALVFGISPAPGAGLEPGLYTSPIGPALLLRQGNRFELRIQAKEGIYRVVGTFEHEQVRCLIIGPGGNQLPCQGSAGGDSLEIRTGAESYRFTRAGPGGQPGQRAASPGSPAGGVSRPGEVRDPGWGILFTPPQGWIARKKEEGYLLGSQTRKGLIIVIPSEVKNLEEARVEAMKGWVEPNGTRLFLTGPLQSLGGNSLAGDFRGTVENVPAKARMAVVLSPFGNGVLVIAMAEEASYTEEYGAFADAIIRSVRFFRPATPPVVQEWINGLRGQKLTYLHTYGDFRGSGAYGGGSTKKERFLCSNGRFFARGESSFSAGSGGSSASGSDRGGGAGQWRVTAQAGRPVLEFHYKNGNVERHPLAYQGGKTYLSGKRWFVTGGNKVCR